MKFLTKNKIAPQNSTEDNHTVVFFARLLSRIFYNDYVAVDDNFYIIYEAIKQLFSSQGCSAEMSTMIFAEVDVFMFL